jgi:hypothetical protein
MGRNAFTPGLLPGLGGVAYQLLRVNPEHDLPSILTAAEGCSERQSRDSVNLIAWTLERLMRSAQPYMDATTKSVFQADNRNDRYNYLYKPKELQG